MSQAFSRSLALVVALIRAQICLAGSGAIDPGFRPVQIADPELGYVRGVSTLALQPDGKILVGGGFSSVQGQTRHGIARLKADGSLDESFSPATRGNATVTSIALQPDGRILVNTGIPDAEGRYPASVIRLQEDGTLDASFQAPPEIWGTQLILAPNGAIYVAGGFRLQGTNLGPSHYYLAWLNANGALDETYWPPVGPYSTVAESGEVKMTLQSDGKIVLGGMFSALGGASFLARFGNDGSLDSSFNATGSGAYFCNALTTQADGKILHGHTKYLQGSLGMDTYAAVRRINADGSLDRSFRENTDIPGYVQSIATQPDGKVLAGGFFFTPGRYWKQNLVRFNADGSRDDSLAFGEGAFFNTEGGVVNAIVVQPDGKILVGGQFDYPAVDGVSRPDLLRLRGDAAYLTKLKRAATGELEMSWSLADPQKSFRLEVSTDLKNWDKILDASAGSKILEFTSAQFDSPSRFYRLQAE